MHSLKMRALAAVISLATIPGVGHYFLGAYRAAASWTAVFLASSGVLVITCTYGGPAPFVVAVVLASGVTMGAAIDLFRQRTGRIVPWPRILIVAVAAFCLVTWLNSGVRKYFVESFRIPGNSMYPSLMEGDRVLASKVMRTPRRGDVVIHRNADGAAFMKRVMALEWDRIEVRANEVWINGKSLPQQPGSTPCRIEEPCSTVNESNAGRHYTVALSNETSTLNPRPEMRVPVGHMFIMGDGRRWSLDSRMFGPIPVSSTIGTARFVWWPLSRFGVLP